MQRLSFLLSGKLPQSSAKLLRNISGICHFCGLVPVEISNFIKSQLQHYFRRQFVKHSVLEGIYLN